MIGRGLKRLKSGNVDFEKRLDRNARGEAIAERNEILPLHLGISGKDEPAGPLIRAIVDGGNRGIFDGVRKKSSELNPSTPSRSRM